MAPAAPQGQEDKSQKFQDSPDFSGSDWTRLRGWIAQLQMVIQQKPGTFPNDQSKMQYVFIVLRVKIVQHIWEDRTIGLLDPQASIQPRKAAFGDPDRMVTAERNMQETNQGICDL